MTESDLRAVFQKTGGVCHFCGDQLNFEKRGRGGGAKGLHDVPPGYWEVDHVFQTSRGGSKTVANCLAACTACNGIRWHRRGAYIRTTLLLGLAARELIRRGGGTGNDVLAYARSHWPHATAWPELGVRKKKKHRSDG